MMDDDDDNNNNDDDDDDDDDMMNLTLISANHSNALLTSPLFRKDPIIGLKL